MNKLLKKCKSTMVAGALGLAFAPALAAGDNARLLLAQAETGQQQSNGAASSNNAADGGAESSGASGAAQGGQAASGQGGGKQDGTAKAPIYLLVPVETAANDSAMKNGCWARLYSRDNYSGDMLTLVGPTSLPDMDSSGFFGLNWDDRVESLELGPKATMTVYDNENYRDQIAQFKAGQRTANVSRRVGLFDEFASLRLDCQQG